VLLSLCCVYINSIEKKESNIDQQINVNKFPMRLLFSAETTKPFNVIKR